MWLIIWMNRFKMFLQLSFLRISMITDRDLFQLFFNMNWFSMIFQIDFFRKIIVTILSCFLTSCLNKNLEEDTDPVHIKKSWKRFLSVIIDLIIYNCLSLSWVETQRVCLTFSWDETEFYLKRSCVYKLKMISCNSTLCLFTWISISAEKHENMLSFNSTQTQTIVNDQV